MVVLRDSHYHLLIPGEAITMSDPSEDAIIATEVQSVGITCSIHIVSYVAVDTLHAAIVCYLFGVLDMTYSECHML